MEHPLLMTTAELRCLRESLGMTVRDLALAIGWHERNVHRWESGDSAVTRAAADALNDLVAFTDRLVDQLAEAHPAGSTITVYPDGKASLPDELAAYGDRRLSAAWYRAAAWRAADRTGARIAYAVPRTDESGA